MNDIWHNSETTGNDRLVMLAIADNADEEKRMAWPSASTISRKTKIPLRTVFRCIKRCVEMGELEIVEKGKSEGHSNMYRILVEKWVKGGSDKMTGVPRLGIGGKPQLGTLTVIEPSVHNTLAKGSLEECVDFCKCSGLEGSDGVWFFNKCEGNGWTNNGKPIRNWRATIRAWQSAGYMPSQKKQSQGSLPLFGKKKFSVFEMSKIAEAKQKIAEDWKRKHSSDVAGGTQWDSTENKMHYIAIKREITDINMQIAESTKG